MIQCDDSIENKVFYNFQPKYWYIKEKLHIVFFAWLLYLRIPKGTFLQILGSVFMEKM